jgi:GNAT superfamily N-acetyltransferase
MRTQPVPHQHAVIGGFEIVEMSERPDLREQVAQINFRQWAQFSDLTLDDMRRLFAVNAPGDPLPVTFLALSHDEVNAVVSLRRISMGAITHPEVYLPHVEPWLSNMWVAEVARGHKLATRLSFMVEDRARELGYETLYSSTTLEQSLYHAIGFETVAVREHQGSPVYVISKKIPANRV